MTAWTDMKHDLRDYPSDSWWDDVKAWATYYWWPTRRWLPKVSMWWDTKVLRYPPCPPLVKDRVARHHGFAMSEGVPPCTDGPICAEHGWPLSPLVTGERDA